MYTFKVNDMTCGGCAASIRKAVSRIPGVSGVDTDPHTRSVVVEAGAEVSRDTVVSAFNAAGYLDVRAVEAGAASSS